MKETGFIVFFVLLTIYGILTIIYSWKLYKFFNHFKENEFEEWKEIRKPHLVSNNALVNNLKFYIFLYKNMHLVIKNREDREKAEAIKKLLISGLVVFPIIVALMFTVVL